MMFRVLRQRVNPLVWLHQRNQPLASFTYPAAITALAIFTPHRLLGRQTIVIRPWITGQLRLIELLQRIQRFLRAKAQELLRVLLERRQHVG